ncbi:hypothetical protein [Ruicaihuangia caeni]|uniref:WXG100 family type VII secretion target n=1 Tax=Ruicaihuangia caeni TaxID=3042517 RepID=A0AAW6TB67_9MICO|nr:hypothetical protein [Klugiella sp. YN-L-19]MDI2099078.1 hypothetical protein [Klugiella sp. YN-L-19]
MSTSDVAEALRDHARALKELERDLLQAASAARLPEEADWFGVARGAYEAAHGSLMAQLNAARDALVTAEAQLWRVVDGLDTHGW